LRSEPDAADDFAFTIASARTGVSGGARNRPRWATSLATVLGPGLGLIAAIALAVWWMASTSFGLRVAAALVDAVVPGVSIQGVDGTLVGGLRASRVAISRASWSVRIDELAIEPRAWSPWERRFDIERLAARRAQVDWVTSSGPSTAPDSLGVPLELIVRQARIEELALGSRDATPLTLRRVELAGRAGAAGIAVERFGTEIEKTRISATGTVGALPPFATQAEARLETTVQERAVTAVVSARGSLQELAVQLRADDAAARAHASATVRAFADVPLEQLQAEIESLDPALWFDDVPSMQLRAGAQLLPAHRADGGWSVSGPFWIENGLAGPVDRNRVPLRSLRGSLAWSAAELALDIDRAEGVRGSARGTLRWSSADGLAVDSEFSGIDAATLHSRAVATNAVGRLNYRLSHGEQRFDGNARNASGLPLSAEVVAAIRDHVLDLSTGRLQLGGGRADLRGRLELRGAQALQLSGRFSDLDLAQLVRGVDTRLNGSLELGGRLAPVSGQGRFELAESRIAGRPITGRGTVNLAGSTLDADIDLRSGEARLAALGGLGAGRELRIDLLAPEIGSLLPGYTGRVEAQATLAGEIDALSVVATAAATNLRTPGGHQVANLTSSLRGGTAANAALAVTMKLTGHVSPSGPDSSVAGATLIGRGTTTSATLELNGATASQQPFRAIVDGGWRDGAWRGSLVAAEVGTPLDLLLRTPAPLAIAPASVALGPMDFQLRGARFSAVELSSTNGRWRTSGSFAGMQPQSLDAQARAPRRVVRSGAGDRVPLTLAGRWDLEYTDTLNGIAVVERTGGDIYSGIDALNPIGVSDVGAALSVVDSRVTGNVYVRGRALGKIDAEIDTYVDPAMPAGRLLAQNRPFRVLVDATLPDLSWIGPLIGDNVQFGGKATINAAIGGTPADPTSTGTIRGDALRLAWVDQAVRLDNGTLDAVLEDGVLVINELLFTGTPRVAPGDKRALGGLVAGLPSEVRAVGRIALATLAGSIGVQATQLPVLQRTDRWMVLSGTGGITLTPQRAELYAKLRIDGAYINFDGLRAGRSLPGDVVVVRTRTQRKATAASAPVDVSVDLKGDLGDRFYIEGAGIEARLAGEVSVAGRPAQLRAYGSVRALDGVYAGYGQRLQIERGIVTFQGPIDNPALNVLAVRAGLPVEVGVAIGGTAQRPFVRLHSDPAMSDTEKLNWLVLGRPPGPSDGNDRAVLSAAASALFSGQADSASAGLMRSLGIDQISLQPGQSSGSLLPRETVAGRLRSGGVSTSSAAAADFLAVGKRINDDLFLSFEQALSGAEYFVALNYRLTRQLSLIARAGSTNALDLVYSIAFD
jgi:translocation and assembly module TamB